MKLSGATDFRVATDMEAIFFIFLSREPELPFPSFRQTKKPCFIIYMNSEQLRKTIKIKKKLPFFAGAGADPIWHLASDFWSWSYTTKSGISKHWFSQRFLYILVTMVSYCAEQNTKTGAFSWLMFV